MTSRKIYLASSWRNAEQPKVLYALRAAGLDVYDFRNPAPGNNGFGWRQIDPSGAPIDTAAKMRTTLAHPVAQAGFDHDVGAMRWADACVLLLPCGLSAHLEAGWFAGAGKPVAILAPEIKEPELMYKLFDVETRRVFLDKLLDGGLLPIRLAVEAETLTPIFDNINDVIAFLFGMAVMP